MNQIVALKLQAAFRPLAIAAQDHARQLLEQAEMAPDPIEKKRLLDLSAYWSNMAARGHAALGALPINDFP